MRGAGDDATGNESWQDSSDFPPGRGAIRKCSILSHGCASTTTALHFLRPRRIHSYTLFRNRRTSYIVDDLLESNRKNQGSIQQDVRTWLLPKITYGPLRVCRTDRSRRPCNDGVQQGNAPICEDDDEFAAGNHAPRRRGPSVPAHRRLRRPGSIPPQQRRTAPRPTRASRCRRKKNRSRCPWRAKPTPTRRHRSSRRKSNNFLPLHTGVDMNRIIKAAAIAATTTADS